MRTKQLSLIALAVIIAGLGAGCRRRAAVEHGAAGAQTSGGAYDAYAAAMGYPARHSAQELEQFLAQHLAGYEPVAGARREGRLEGFQPISVTLDRGYCYMMVLRLAPNASYSARGEAGLSFVFQPASGGATVNGGPGIHGPGGAGSAGCPQQRDTYEFALQPIVGGAPGDLGTGDYVVELWAQPVSEQQLGAQAADREQQIAESRAFQERQRAEEAARNAQGCDRCAARYEGCLGARIARSQCDSDYRSCAFQEVGADYLSACPSPR